MDVDAANIISGGEQRLAAGQAGGFGVEIPIERRLADAAIDRAQFKARNVQYLDIVIGERALEILIALRIQVKRIAVLVPRDKTRRSHFGVHQLSETVYEGKAEYE